MMKTIYLTAQEKNIYDALPDDVREGWEVEDETVSYQDSDAKRATRFALLRLHDPKLLAFRDVASKVKNIEDLNVLNQRSDLSDVQDADLAELFFALGPEVLTHLIGFLFPSISDDEALEDIVALTVIRHSFLTSL